MGLGEVLFRDVRPSTAALTDSAPTDVLIAGGRVRRIGRMPGFSGEVVECRGAALLPGLHDHHLHLFAAAAAIESVSCGPPQVRDGADLAVALQRAPGSGWIRGFGYDERVAGRLDRVSLDAIMADRPMRLQHRGGSLWTLNSRAVELLGLDHAEVEGNERDTAGRSTGRLWRADEWLRIALASQADNPPDLAKFVARLATYGITGVTDAGTGDATALASAVQQLPLRVASMGKHVPSALLHAARKIVVSDHHLPGLGELTAAISSSHRAGRPVAVHSVTRESLWLTLAAFHAAGVASGDRVEHAALCPAEAIPVVRDLGLVVVTQPSLITLRGDAYMANVEADDRGDLWRYASLLNSGVPVIASSDAPYGDANPWATLRAARDRLTPEGVVLGCAERVQASTALAGFLVSAADPSGAPRGLDEGDVADLVLLDVTLQKALADPDPTCVRMTFVAGVPVYRRAD